LAGSSIRILVVDDFEPFRRIVASMFQKQPELQIICEVSDGLEAVQKAKELQPDLILLDIGLPKLHGIEAGRRIRKVSPTSLILFVSLESSADVVQEALNSGAQGYVIKSDVGSELLTALNAVLRGETFVSSRLAGQDFTGASVIRAPEGIRRSRVSPPLSQQNIETTRRHKVGFYSDDRGLLDDLSQFIGAALKAGNTAIVVATESHRDSVLPRLQAHGVDIGAAIEQGRYIALDAADTLSALMLNDMPDPARFFKLLGDLIVTAAESTKKEQARVAIFGECAHLLWARGNEEAVELERVGNQLINSYDVDILCGYSLGAVHGGMDSQTFHRICAQHSAVYSRREERSG